MIKLSSTPARLSYDVSPEKMAQLIEVTTPDIAGLRGPYKVIRLAVADHSEVQVGDIIAEVDGPDAIIEIESFDAGRVEFVVGIGQVLEPNQLIANISSLEPQSGCSLSLKLQSKHLRILDGFRGSLSRHDYILSLITNPDDSEGESGRREVLTPAPHTTGHTDP